MAFYYDADDYFNWNQPEHEIDVQIDPSHHLTYEEREKRWQERRWLNEPEVVADDWLFAPLPSGKHNEF